LEADSPYRLLAVVVLNKTAVRTLEVEAEVGRLSLEKMGMLVQAAKAATQPLAAWLVLAH
jgi:hypothetical protein